jgi:predicted nucleotidyltransferase
MLLLESIIDYTLKFYSPYVFSDYKSETPKIREDLRQKILSDIKLLGKIIPIKDFFIKGSILTKKYNRNSDIDVFIVTNDKNLRFGDIKSTWERIDNKKFKDCPHPLQYYISTQDYNIDNTDGAYDIKNNEWIKKTVSKDIDLNLYLNEFQEWVDKLKDFSEDVRESYIDYEVLKSLPKNSLKNLNQKIDKKLEELEKSITSFISTYDELKEYRNISFQKEMTPSEIKKYGSKTALPGNVIYKLIERYYYKYMAEKIKKIIGPDKILDVNELEELNDLLKTPISKESVSLRSIFEKDMFGRTEHRQQKITAGMRNMHKRTSQNILPFSQRKSPNKLKKKNDIDRGQSKLIKIDPNTPYGRYLIRKYRITDPTGKKQIGGNKYSKGFTIEFINT